MADNAMPDGLGPDDLTASDRAETNRNRTAFTLKELGDATLWITIEPYEPGLPSLKRGDSFLGLEPRAGIMFEQAKRFVDGRSRISSSP